MFVSLVDQTCVYSRCTMYISCKSQDRLSAILLSDCVPGRSLLVISPDVFSIVLLLDCVPGRSLLVISPDVFSIMLLLDCV